MLKFSFQMLYFGFLFNIKKSPAGLFSFAL